MAKKITGKKPGRAKSAAVKQQEAIRRDLPAIDPNQAQVSMAVDRSNMTADEVLQARDVEQGWDKHLKPPATPSTGSGDDGKPIKSGGKTRQRLNQGGAYGVVYHSGSDANIPPRAQFEQDGMYFDNQGVEVFIDDEPPEPEQTAGSVDLQGWAAKKKDYEFSVVRDALRDRHHKVAANEDEARALINVLGPAA